VVPPEAVSVAVLPEQIEGEFTVTVGVGLTVKTEVLLPEHPLVVPVTVYVVELPGFAVTVDPVVALNPVEGVQLYVVPPEAVSVVEVPEQMVAELTVTVGLGLTVTAEVLSSEQLPVVPVTV